MKNKSLAGHLAAAGAYAIFGVNIVFCKDIAASHAFTPIALFSMRAIGASLLFWLLSLCLPKEKVALEDFPKIAAASFVGLFTPQLTFLKAVTISTTIDIAILGTLSPIFTMFIAAAVLKEPISFKKASGVAISLAGVLILIFNSVHAAGAVERTTPLGMALLFLNCLSFAAYLGIFRPLIGKYNVVTFMKWMFLFSLLFSLPFSGKDLVMTNYSLVEGKVWLETGFLIVFATFVAYFLIPVGQKNIRPTLVSMYSYLQPIIAVALSICIGMDKLSWQKAAAVVFVFTGLSLVNSSRKK